MKNMYDYFLSLHLQGVDMEKQISAKLSNLERVTRHYMLGKKNFDKITIPYLQQFSAIIMDTLYHEFDCGVDLAGSLFYEYCQKGGHLVVMCFSNARSKLQYLGGSFEKHLHPLTFSPNFTNGHATMKPLTPQQRLQHPLLLQNVATFDGGNFSGRVPCQVRDHVTLVAQWHDDTPLIAYRQTAQYTIVALNFVAGSNACLAELWDKNTDGAQLMCNALRFAAGNRKEWNTKLHKHCHMRNYTDVIIVPV